MIRLIRQDGVEILLNVDIIKSIQGAGPTVISLANGEKLEVKKVKAAAARVRKTGSKESSPGYYRENQSL